MAIPQDTFMLLIFINMKLRDGDYDTLSDLCDSLGCNRNDVIQKLKDAGFEYNPSTNQFR